MGSLEMASCERGSQRSAYRRFPTPSLPARRAAQISRGAGVHSDELYFQNSEPERICLRSIRPLQFSAQLAKWQLTAKCFLATEILIYKPQRRIFVTLHW